jgi:hypothetical protein
MSRKVEPDFWLYRWQFDDRGRWIDSITQEERELPPIEQHKREWCHCPLCDPKLWKRGA